MRFLIASIIVVSSFQPASADLASDMIRARELGQIVGSAEMCGYILDAEKVSGVVSEALTKMDPVARAAFQSGSGAHKVRLDQMSSLERKVSCETQRKVAAKYGILAK